MQKYLQKKTIHLNQLAKILKHTYTTKENFTKFLQKKFLRKKKKERINLKENLFLLLFKQRFLEKFTLLDLVDSIPANKKKYDDILILGAGPKDLTYRIESFLKKRPKNKRLFILTGYCPLKKKEQKWLKKTHNIQASCEKDMAQALNVKYNLSATIVESLNLGSGARSNTKDTAVEFLKLYQPKNSVLIVSNQPYGLYQKAIFDNVLNSSVDVLAQKSPSKIKISLYLDTLARLLYEL